MNDKKPCQNLQVALGAISMEEALKRVRCALGLFKPDTVKDGEPLRDGQFHIFNDGKNKILALHGAGLDALAGQLIEDPDHLKRAALVDDIKAGKHDEANWLPEGFSRRPAIDVSGGPDDSCPPAELEFHLDGVEGDDAPAQITARLKEHIAQCIEAGHDPISIAGDLRTEAFQATHVPKELRGAYRDAVNDIAPSLAVNRNTADDKSKMDAQRKKMLGLHDDWLKAQVAAGTMDSDTASVHRQTLPQDWGTRDLAYQVAIQDPRLQHAFAPTGDLSRDARAAIRDYALEKVFTDRDGKPLKGKGKEEPIEPLDANERKVFDTWRAAHQQGLSPYAAIQQHWRDNDTSGTSSMFGDAEPHDFASVDLGDDAAVIAAAKRHADDLGYSVEHRGVDAKNFAYGEKAHPELEVTPERSQETIAANARKRIQKKLREHLVGEMAGQRELVGSFDPASVHTAGNRWAEYVTDMGHEDRAYRSIQEKMRGDFAGRFAKGYEQLHGSKFNTVAVPLSHADAHAQASLSPDKREALTARRQAEAASVRKRENGAQFAAEGAGAVAGKLEAKKQAALLDGALFGASEGKTEAEQCDTHRLSLGAAAESMVGGMLPKINLRQGTVAAGDINMSSEKGVKRQRAIKQIEAVGRVALSAGVGFGKTAVMLGAHGHLAAQGKVKRTLMAVPSVVQEQFGSEAARFFDPTSEHFPTWHANSGASAAERRASYRDDSGYDINVVTHQALRDDLTWAVARHQFGGDTEAAKGFMLAAPAADRRQAVQAACAAQGWNHDMTCVDEGHVLLGRRSKADSAMANVIDAFTHDKAYHVSASADVAKNDATECFSVLSKIAPHRFVEDNDPNARDKHGNPMPGVVTKSQFYRKYAVNTMAAHEALQREMAPYQYAEAIAPDVKSIRVPTIPMAMTQPQQADYNAVTKNYQRARAARQRGAVDVHAVKALSPSSFDGVDEKGHEDHARQLSQSLGILRDAAYNRVVNLHPAGVKMQRLTQRIKEMPPSEHPKIIFAHDLAAVDLIHDHLKKMGVRVGKLTGAMSGKDKERARLDVSPQWDDRAGDYVAPPKTDVLVASDAGSVGGNLQRCSHVLCWDNEMTAMCHNQRIGRALRTGQRHNVTLEQLATDSDFERGRRKLLARKQSLREALTTPAEMIDDSGLAARIQREQAAAVQRTVGSAVQRERGPLPPVQWQKGQPVQKGIRFFVRKGLFDGQPDTPVRGLKGRHRSGGTGSEHRGSHWDATAAPITPQTPSVAPSHDVSSLHPDVASAFNAGHAVGDIANNPHILTSDTSDAYVMGAYAKVHGLAGRVKKRGRYSFFVGDRLFEVDGKKVTEKGAAPPSTAPPSQAPPPQPAKQYSAVKVTDSHGRVEHTNGRHLTDEEWAKWQSDIGGTVEVRGPFATRDEASDVSSAWRQSPRDKPFMPEAAPPPPSTLSKRERSALCEFRGDSAARPWDAHDEAKWQELQELKARRFKSAAVERSIEFREAEIKANPAKWQVGDGVGYKVHGGRAMQTNRGFRIVAMDEANKMVKVRSVADTGLTSSGGDHDRIGDSWVHLGTVVRDKKYNRVVKALMLSKAHATGYPLQGRRQFRGLDISIEQRTGSWREDKQHDPPQWRTKMLCPYGYVRCTESSADHDHLDVFIGPDEMAPNVYIVNQNDPKSGKFDEQKFMLGFRSADAAKAMYLKHYDSPKFFGSMETMPFEEFRRKALATLPKGGGVVKAVDPEWLKGFIQAGKDNRKWLDEAMAKRKTKPGEDCPHCGASMEQGDDKTCNQCRKPWPDSVWASADLSGDGGQGWHCPWCKEVNCSDTPETRRKCYKCRRPVNVVEDDSPAAKGRWRVHPVAAVSKGVRFYVRKGVPNQKDTYHYDDFGGKKHRMIGKQVSPPSSLQPNPAPAPAAATQTGIHAPAFKAWFGDWQNNPQSASKVVDANGQPLVVFHGTMKAGFTQFHVPAEDEVSRFGPGVYCAEDPRYAEIYGKSEDHMAAESYVAQLERKLKAARTQNEREWLQEDLEDARRNVPTAPPGTVHGVHLNIRHPLRLDEPIDAGAARALLGAHYDAARHRTGADVYDAVETVQDSRSGANRFLQSHGYDGILETEHTEGRASRVWIAFRSEQVRFADAHDPNDAPGGGGPLSKSHDCPRCRKCGDWLDLDDDAAGLDGLCYGCTKRLEKGVRFYVVSKAVPNVAHTYHYEQGPGTVGGAKHRAAGTKPVVPPFHSKLLRAVESLPFRTAPASKVRAFFDKGALPKEEREWAGVDEHLNAAEKAGQEVNRDALVKHASEHLPRFKEKIYEYRHHPPEAEDGDLQTALAYVEECEQNYKDADTEEAYEYWGEALNDAKAIVGEIQQDREDFGTKYHEHQVPGGKNYKELLIQVGGPDMESFDSPHFPDDGNVLAHIRFNERKDKDGHDLLFIETLQSDVHQHGRKHGYVGDIKELPEGYEVKPHGAVFIVTDDGGKTMLADGQTKEEALADALEVLNDTDDEGIKRAPNVPLKGHAWKRLCLRRMIRHAAEHGIDHLAWGTGKMQSERWISAPTAGMEGFYDRELVNLANEIGKKYGAKVETTEIDDDGTARPVHALRITPELRDAVLHEGQPLFKAVRFFVSTSGGKNIFRKSSSVPT